VCQDVGDRTFTKLHKIEYKIQSINSFDKGQHSDSKNATSIGAIDKRRQGDGGDKSLCKTASGGETTGASHGWWSEVRVHEGTPWQEHLGRPPGKSKVIAHTSLAKWGETS
jgi:hypothetical protein